MGVFTHPEYTGAMTPDLAVGKQGGIQQMSTQGMVWDLSAFKRGMPLS